MPAIQHLLRRWGFVKLRRYGLELTPDGRIVSNRPVLDDGTGARVVGWQDGDVAIWKLSPWAEGSVSTTPPAAEVAAPPVLASPPEPAKPSIPEASEAAAPPSRPSARVMSAEVAGEPAVDEDDWEWTIALARARFAVDEAEAAWPPTPAPPPPRREAPPVVTAPPVPPPQREATPTLTTKSVAPPPPVVTASPVVTPPPRAAAPAMIGPPMIGPDDWMRPESVTGEYEDYRVTTTREIPHVPMAAVPRGAPPSTVIPVPALPMVDASICSRLEPVVRSTQIQSQSITGRFAKGTAPVDPPSAHGAGLVEDTIPNLSIGDRTKPGIAPAKRSNGAATSEVTAVGERTKPGIALPTAARTVSLPSIKGRSAPR
jgi:hypothetical protein